MLNTQKSAITTHVLDTAKGLPAANIKTTLCIFENDQWQHICEAKTDSDGRIMQWPNDEKLSRIATYKICFSLTDYLQQTNQPVFYPYAEIVFNRNDDNHHHIPLLLSPHGYSTYRGS